jgi:hypothetical protein
MALSLAEILVFAAVAAYFGWAAAMSLRAGRVELYLNPENDWLFSRRGSPGPYWVVVCFYGLLALGSASIAAILSLAMG